MHVEPIYHDILRTIHQGHYGPINATMVFTRLGEKYSITKIRKALNKLTDMDMLVRYTEGYQFWYRANGTLEFGGVGGNVEIDKDNKPIGGIYLSTGTEIISLSRLFLALSNNPQWRPKAIRNADVIQTVIARLYMLVADAALVATYPEPPNVPENELLALRQQLRDYKAEVNGLLTLVDSLISTDPAWTPQTVFKSLLQHKELGLTAEQTYRKARDLHDRVIKLKRYEESRFEL